LVTPRQPYYYGTPTPRGTPLPGSADPEEGIWRKWLFDEALPGLGKGLAGTIPGVAIPGMGTSSGIMKPAATQKTRDDLWNQELQNLARGQRTVFSDSYEWKLPWMEDKGIESSVGKALFDTATGITPFDVALSGTFASKVLPWATKGLAAKSASATNWAKKVGWGIIPAIVEPISRSTSFADRFAAELAFDQAIKASTEAGGIGFGLTAPTLGNMLTRLSGRAIIGVGKKGLHNIPTLDDYLKNPEAVNQIRPTRIIPGRNVPTIAGGATDPKPTEFYGRDTSAPASGTSPDPRFLTGGEFQRINFKVKLMDANDIITSNDPYSPTFARDPKYPTVKQPRDRFGDPATAVEEKQSLVDMARKLRADDLIDDTSRMDSGMPVIGEYHVESGNKRIMAIKLARKDYPEVYNEYLFGNKDKKVRGLRNRLEEYGIAKTQLDQFDLTEQIPVLVRERQTILPNDAISPYVVDANKSGLETFSAFEEAGQLAEGWSDNLLTRIIPVGKNIRTTLQSNSNAETVNAFRSFIKGNPNVKNWFRGGKLTEEGTDKLVQGLRVKIFGQDNADFLTQSIDLLPDNQTKSLFNSIEESLPQFSLIKGKTNKFTEATDYDLSDETISAIRKFRSIKDRARESGQSLKTAVDEYLQQGQMFAEFASDPMETQLLILFNGVGKQSATSKQISSVLSKYEELVEQHIGQATMFERRTKLEMLEEAIRKAAPEGTETVTDSTGRVVTALDEEVPSGLESLSKQAAKTESLEKFIEDFGKGKTGKYYHITDDPNFKIDIKKGPTDFSSASRPGVAISPGQEAVIPTGKNEIIVTNAKGLKTWSAYYNDIDLLKSDTLHPTTVPEWFGPNAEFYRRQGLEYKTPEKYLREEQARYPEDKRKYVAIINTDNLNPDDLKEFTHATGHPRNFAAEFLIADPTVKGATVEKVIPVEQALKENLEYQELLNREFSVDEDVGKIWQQVKGIEPIIETKSVNDPNFDKDVDDPLPEKKHKEIKKQIKEDGGYKKGEEPNFGREGESDINPPGNRTPVTKENPEMPVIRTPDDDAIKMTTRGRARHNEKPLEQVVQKEPIVIEADINNADDASKVVPTPAFKQLLGDGTINISYSPKTRIVNNLYSFLRSLKLKPELLKIKQKEGNLIEGMIDYWERKTWQAETQVTRIGTTVDYRLNSVFDINKNGTVNNVPLIEKQVTDRNGNVVLKKGKPIIKKFKPTLVDMAARWPKYVGELSEKQVKAMESVQDEVLPVSQLWAQLEEVAEKYGLSNYLDAITIRGDIMEEGFYLPRGGEIADGTLDTGRVIKNRAKPWNQTAKFDSQGEGIDNGYEYDSLKNSIQKLTRGILNQHINIMLETASKNFRDASGEPVWKTLNDLVEMENPGLKVKLDGIDKEWSRLTGLKNMLKVRTQDIVDTQLDEHSGKLDKLYEILSKKLYVIKAGPNTNYTRKQIVDALNDLKKQLSPVRQQYKSALKRIDRQGYEGYKKIQDLGYKELSNLYLDETSATAFNNFFESLNAPQKAGVLQFMQTFNAAYLMTKSTVDFSGPGIQGSVGMWTNPKVWGKATIANFQAFVDPHTLGKKYADFDAQATKTGRLNVREAINEGLIQNDSVFQVQMGVGASLRMKATLDKLGGMSRLSFNRAFTDFGNVYRLGEFDSLIEEAVARGRTIEDMRADGTLRTFAEIANKLSGTMNVSRRYGRFTDIAAAVLFAQRYYMTLTRKMYKAIKGTANPFTKDLEAKIFARRYQKFFAYTTTVTFLINSAQGEETDFSPIVRDPKTGKWRKNGNFMALHIPFSDKQWTLMGSTINIPGHIFTFVAGTANAIQNKSPKRALEQLRDTLRSVGSGMFKLGIDLGMNKEWNGTPIWDTRDWTEGRESQVLTDILMYLGDAFAPFSFEAIGEIAESGVENAKEFLESTRRIMDLGVLVRDYGVDTTEAILEFGGWVSSDQSYTDILIQETRKRGIDFTRLEPHQKGDFKEIVQEKYAKEKRGLIRTVGQLWGRSTEALGTPIQRLQEQRIFKQREYLARLKRGYGKGGIYDFYGPKDFAEDVRNADDDYYTKKQGQIEKDGDPYVDDHSYEESSENIIASEQYYDMMEVYYDKELEETDPAKYPLQEKLFLGQEIELKDGSVIGNWTPEQIEYVTRNINDLYYEPEVLEKMMQYGRMGTYPLKYWYQSRNKSEEARLRFKNAGSPGSALDPNAVFLWDSKTFNLRVQIPDQLPFVGYLNENAVPTPTPMPVPTPMPEPMPTPSTIGTGGTQWGGR